VNVRVKRVLRWAVGIVAGLVLLSAGLLWYGLSSESAAERLISMGLARAGETVKIGRISGRLRGPLVLRDVTVKTTAFGATVDSVLLEWSPTGLVHRQVRIDRLHITGVHLVLPDSVPPDTAPPTRPRLPMDVLLGDVLVQQVSVNAPGDLLLRDGVVRLTGRA
jgi:translocation and assembly module TamB